MRDSCIHVSSKPDFRVMRILHTHCCPQSIITMDNQKNERDHTPVTIRHRRSDGGAGFVDINVTKEEARTQGGLQYLKTRVIQALQPRWGTEFELQQENILIFRVSDDETTVSKITDDSDIDWELPGERFLAVEYFSTVPTDLFRTATNEDLCRVTYTHPDHVGRYTNVSPLSCACFRFHHDETSTPWFGMKTKIGTKKKKFVVHGVPLQCSDNSEEAVEDFFDPFTQEPSNEDERKDVVRSISIDAFEESGFGSFGFLFSSYTHALQPPFGFSYKSHIYTYNYSEAEKEQKSKDGFATERHTYLRFKLAQGIDLSPYGVAVVCDNSSHFSLVLSGEEWNPQAKGYWQNQSQSLIFSEERWNVQTEVYWTKRNQIEDRLYLPEDTWPVYNQIASDDNRELNRILREALQPGDHEPEYYNDMRALYLPKVAGLFSLHDLKLEARAKPCALSPDDKHYLIYEAAMVLFHSDLAWEVHGFHSDLAWEVYLAIRALENADYSLERITPSQRDILEEAIEKAEYDGFDYAKYVLGLDSTRVNDAVHYGMKYALWDLQERSSEMYEDLQAMVLRGKI